MSNIGLLRIFVLKCPEICSCYYSFYYHGLEPPPSSNSELILKLCILEKFISTLQDLYREDRNYIIIIIIIIIVLCYFSFFNWHSVVK
jgi:hypothetical protein